MTKFYGSIGYGESTETPADSGIYADVITEYSYYGDVVRNTRKLESGESLNDDVTVGNSLSVLADQYALKHFFAIRYVRWMGTLWTVTNVEVRSPRLVLSLGSVYNGPRYIPPPEADITITDNGDGTWTASGLDERITLLNSYTFQLLDVDAVYLDADTYEVSTTV